MTRRVIRRSKPKERAPVPPAVFSDTSEFTPSPSLHRPDRPKEFCKCSGRSGWTNNPDYKNVPHKDLWVCGECGYPTHSAWTSYSVRNPYKPRRVIRRSKK